jgi:hypothetical protein
MERRKKQEGLVVETGRQAQDIDGWRKIAEEAKVHHGL